jgi:hypothetical protein
LEIAAGGSCHVRCRESDPRAFEEELAGLREADPTGMTLQQPDAELALERADLLREAGLGNPQPLGGAGEASLFGDRDEVAKVTQFHLGLLKLRWQTATSAATPAAAASSASSAAT